MVLVTSTLQLKLLVSHRALLRNRHNFHRQHQQDRRRRSPHLLPQLKPGQMANEAGRDLHKQPGWHVSGHQLARYGCLFSGVPRGAGKGARSCKAASFPCSTVHLPTVRRPSSQTAATPSLLPDNASGIWCLPGSGIQHKCFKDQHPGSSLYKLIMGFTGLLTVTIAQPECQMSSAGDPALTKPGQGKRPTITPLQGTSFTGRDRLRTERCNYHAGER